MANFIRNYVLNFALCIFFLFCVLNECKAQQSGKNSKQNIKNSNAGLNARNDNNKLREDDETPFCTSDKEEKCVHTKYVRRKNSITWIQMNAPLTNTTMV